MYIFLGKVIYLLSGMWLVLVWHCYPDFSFRTHNPLLGLIPLFCVFLYELFPDIYKCVKQHIAQKDSDQSDGSAAGQ